MPLCKEAATVRCPVLMTMKAIAVGSFATAADPELVVVVVELMRLFANLLTHPNLVGGRRPACSFPRNKPARCDKQSNISAISAMSIILEAMGAESKINNHLDCFHLFIVWCKFDHSFLFSDA